MRGPDWAAVIVLDLRFLVGLPILVTAFNLTSSTLQVAGCRSASC
jgi:hypothetical protein